MPEKGATISPPKTDAFTCATPAVKAQAGRMVLQDGIVVPIMTNGHLCLLRDPLKNSLEMAWFALDGSEEYRVLLPPGRVKACWVEKCRPSRVILFDLDDGKQLFFFWMQSRSTEFDEPMMAQVQQLLYRNQQSPITLQKSQKIQLPTMHKILREVWAEAVAQDIELSHVLSSCKLLEALQEDNEFYASRLQEYLPPSGGRGVSQIDVVKLVREPQVQWTACILSTMLRHEVTYNHLSTAFLDDPTPWGVDVISFLATIIQMFAMPDEYQPA